MIGQLPKEAGGNYTTGAANVVFALSECYADGVHKYTFATNAKNTALKRMCIYKNEYIGYRFIDIFSVVSDFLFHPKRSLREWMHYVNIDHENPLRFAFYKANIKRAIKWVKPDLIHVHSIANVSCTRFASGNGIPILLTCHGIFYRGNNERLGDRYFGNLGYCDSYSGLTRESITEFERYLRISESRVSIIPNGVNTKLFSFSKEMRQRVRKEYNVKDNERVFITVASIQQRKGQLDFLKLLKTLDLDYLYWIVGKGEAEDDVKRYVEENRMENKVKFLGYKTSQELPKFYSAADIYAHPSWKEGQALSEIEAYSTGLKILVNHAIKNTVVGDTKDESIYYVFDFDNIQQNELKAWLLESRTPRKSRINFDWSVIAGKYNELYKKILNK